MQTSGSRPDPGAGYRERLALHRAAEAAAHVSSVRLSNLRAATFVAIAAALLAFDVFEGTRKTWALTVAALLTVVFVLQVRVHRAVRRRERREGALAAVALEGTLRLERDWAGLEASLPGGERISPDVPSGHPYAGDLDVGGTASITRLAGPITSLRGRAALSRWLLRPSPLDEARARQGAVSELAARPEFRAEFTATGRLASAASRGALDAFLDWAEAPPWILGRRGLRTIAWVSPPILLTAAAADVLLGAPPWWLVPALIQLTVLPGLGRWARDTFAAAEGGRGPLTALVPQLALLEQIDWDDPRLRELSETWGRGPDAARRRLAGLLRRLDWVESRRNAVYAALGPLLMLDAHLGASLDRWRLAHGADVRRWLDALGEWEALSALANVAHDHPDWSFPEFSTDGAAVFEARDLGHPLLAPAACVRNDVRVGPPGTFLLVTGSNMSGKSTLLRAIGVNVVLARAGAPVCSAALSLPALRLHTSMRIDDSLAEGVSLFMAELLRVRSIVDAAGSDPGGERQLYLLDEILHGTNTAERRVAARGIIRHLLAAGSIGAVSTHDLTLAEAPDLERAADPVHFRERVEHLEGGGVRLSFDYALRPGLATTRNALELMRAVGLGDLDLAEGAPTG